MSRFTEMLEQLREGQSPSATGVRGGLRWRRERDRSDEATRTRARARQGVIFLLLAGVLLLLFGRAAFWQTVEQSMLAARANAEQVRAFTVDAGRGAIYDANGRVLAVSVTEDTVIADPDVMRSVNALHSDATRLSALLGLPESLVYGELDRPGAYVRLSDASGQPLRLSLERGAGVGVEITRGNLPGVALIPEVRRVYANGDLAAQVLGFVSASNGKGQYGVEQAYERILAGTPGILYTAVDANGDPLATGLRRETTAVPGADMTLTLDANVQYWVEQGLAQTVQQTGATGGTVIVMDPKTGAIIAMASLPSFDPNVYGQSPLASFANPAVSAVYDPGSVMKAVTMAAGIDTGVITPDTSFNDTGSVIVDGLTIHNWDNVGHGVETMTQVLQYSANVGAIFVAQRVGSQRYDAYLNGFGFGQPTGVGLPAESAGLLADPATAGDPALTLAENSFGESIGVTPLQMAAAYCALANNGLLMRPYIVASETAQGGLGPTIQTQPATVRQVVSAQTAQTVTRMLVDSAYKSEAQMNLVKGYAVAAKTGTSTPDTTDPSKTFASVVGYAPASNPRFVLLVKLDAPRTTIFGGSAAGPLWRQLAEQLFTYYQIPPDVPQD